MALFIPQSFELKIDGLLETLETTFVSKPQLNIVNENTQRTISFHTMQAVIKNKQNPSTTHTMMKWLSEPRMRNATLSILKNGNVIESWTYSNLQLTRIDFGAVSSTDEFPDVITFECSFSDVTLNDI